MSGDRGRAPSRKPSSRIASRSSAVEHPCSSSSSSPMIARAPARQIEQRLVDRGQHGRAGANALVAALRVQDLRVRCDRGELCRKLQEDSAGGVARSFAARIKISSVTPTFFWDKRDDSLDPHRGFFTSASVQYAFPLFAAEADSSGGVQGAPILPVSERTTAALSGRVGFIQPYARMLPDAGQDFRRAAADPARSAHGRRRAAPRARAPRTARRSVSDDEFPHAPLPPEECKPTLLATYDATNKVSARSCRWA